MKVSLRQPVPVGAFLLLHGGFLISEYFFLPFVPPGAIGFTIFFLGRRHGQVVGECERCSLIFETSSVLDVSLIWISPQSQLGWHPNQSSLHPHSSVQPHSGAVAARLFDVGRDCCSIGDCGNSPCSHGMGGAPSATLTKNVSRFGVDFFS